jgi:glutamine amidotransferase
VIALIDYGAGNLASVRKALAAVGGDCATPVVAEEIRAASGVIVPGVGHFSATAAIGCTWRQAILDAVAKGTPLLGICLGMQYLFDGSDEAGDLPGLGLLGGRCARLSASVKVPHVGWNGLNVRRQSRLLAAVPHGTQAYFTHSYAAPVTADAVATAAHGAEFAAVVERDNVFGVQFHPEKSSDAGLRIIRNFLEVTRGC